MIPHAIDSNAIHRFQEERLNDAPAEAHACIVSIMQDNCIALDEGGLCLQEWLECAGGKFPFALTDWVADQAIYGRIRYFKLAPNTIRKHLQSLGLPQKDHKWVRLAIGCEGKSIISNDVDFFDPSQKDACAKVKEKLRVKGGRCSKALSKTYGIEVTCISAF